MPTSLRTQLDHLATNFANAVLGAIRSASLEELLAESGASSASRRAAPQGFRQAPPPPLPAARRALPVSKPSGRLARRSPEQIAQVVNKVVLLVKTHKEGMRAEQIRSKLGLLPKEMPRILKDGLASKRLTAKGQKRATTYFAK